MHTQDDNSSLIDILDKIKLQLLEPKVQHSNKISKSEDIGLLIDIYEHDPQVKAYHKIEHPINDVYLGRDVFVIEVDEEIRLRMQVFLNFLLFLRVVVGVFFRENLYIRKKLNFFYEFFCHVSVDQLERVLYITHFAYVFSWHAFHIVLTVKLDISQ